MMDRDLLEPGLGEQAHRFRARVVLRVCRVELVVDGQAALGPVEPRDHLAHVPAQGQRQEAAEGDVGDEGQVRHPHQGGQERMGQALGDHPQRAQQRQVQAIPFPAVQPDAQAAARAERPVGGAHDGLRIRDVMEHPMEKA